MAFWCRIKQSNLRCFSRQFKRSCLQNPYIGSVNYTTSNARFCFIEKPDRVIPKRPTEFCTNSRFFAAPVQTKPKQAEKKDDGPRLNDKITARFVRLVMDEGHRVVPRNEALELARKCNLDLVEVQRTADPPVCKIVDFHREKYKQQLKEKERAKSQVGGTLKKAAPKEVRISMKTEQKDLIIKADAVKRLMESGYRVKCMTVPSNKKKKYGTEEEEEEEDLGGMLHRLLDLINDVSIVESGPSVEKKQAYALVRHTKFGPPKKGPLKKISTVPGVTSTDVQKAAISLPTTIASEDFNSEESGLETDDEFLSEEALNSPFWTTNFTDTPEENKTTWSVSKADDGLDNIFDLRDDIKGSTLSSTPEVASSPANTGPATDFVPLKTVVDSTRTKSAPSPPLDLPPAADNRNRGNEPRNGIPPRFPIQGRLLQSDLNIFPKTGESKQVGNLKVPISEISRQDQSCAAPNPARPSYGIFSAPGQHGVQAKGNSLDSTSSARPEPQLPGQGMQQRHNMNVLPSPRNLKLSPNAVPKQEGVVPATARPSYGIFSASGQHDVPGDVKRNVEGNPVRPGPHLPSQGVQPRFNLNASPSTKQVGNLKRPLEEVSKQEELSIDRPNPTRPSYGIFSVPQPNAEVKKGNPLDSERSSGRGVLANTKLPTSNSDGSQNSGAQGRWGVFSK